MEDLESFVIAPVQQLPRYPNPYSLYALRLIFLNYIMLLSDLLRNTNNTHEDYSTLAKAVEKIREVTIYVNEQKREAEDAATIASKLSLIRGKCPNLAAPYLLFEI